MRMKKLQQVVVGNCEAWGDYGLAKVDQAKSAFKTLRWISFAQSENDIVISHLPIDSRYLEYRKGIVGFVPHVFSPLNLSDSFSLTKKIVCDAELLKSLKSLARPGDEYELQFAAITEESQEISDTLLIPIAAPGITQLKNGQLDSFNSKLNFVRKFRSLGLAEPEGIVAFGTSEIVSAGERLLEKNDSLMLRKAQGANCLGVKPLLRISPSELIEQIQHLDDSWLSEEILVEPHLSLQSSPCTLGFISSDYKAKLVISGDQLFARSTYCWISPSPCSLSILEEMELGFKQYAQSVAEEGAIGWLDIDWGITVKQKLVGIESNYRMTGWTAMAQLVRTLYGEDREQYPKFFSCDVLPLKARFSFEEIFARLKEQGLLFRKEEGEGVFLTSPPVENYVGLAVFGREFSKIYKIIESIHWLSPVFEEFDFQDGIIVSKTSAIGG